jgi:HD-GYP domain-containing protein (c-di-GMP phosphodiesterase class II)
MFTESNISIYDFACALSEVVDLVSPAMHRHHKRVAYIACRIAQEMKMQNGELQDIILASMLHDIGAFSNEDREKMLAVDSYDDTLEQHALSGYKLLKGFAPLANAAALIKHHHARYGNSRRGIPMGSYIMHLADRISVMLDDRREVLQQAPEVRAKIAQRRDLFHPKTLAAFSRLDHIEAFWIEALAPSLDVMMSKNVYFSKEIIGLGTLRQFAKIFAHLIDFRSRFTATHSSGVAAVASELAIIDGFSAHECQLMEIAGFLHDLGKLTVPSTILEKNGALDAAEVHCIKKHTYYTYAVLSKITGLEHIATWAAYHHERLSGNGYPFHVKDEDFSKLARIMAVADVMTALTEDRPYRLGMKREKAVKTLLAMAESGGLDKNIVELANKHFSRINEVRISAQLKAQKEYKAFRACLTEMAKKTRTRSRHEMPVVNSTQSPLHCVL